MISRNYYIGSLILIAGIAGVAGWYIRINYTNTLPSRVTEVRENTNAYHFINPLLFVDSPRQAPEFNPIKKLLSDYINSIPTKNNASSVSVYFRDLNLGKWTGVNEDVVYDPSSMFKVAVMLGYLKAAETSPNILTKKLFYTSSPTDGQHYKPSHSLPDGSYTILDLLSAMIIESDNDALTALYNNDRELFITVLKNFEIPPPPTASTTDFVSPRNYSKIFRTLYSSTYLSRSLSDQALGFMTQTNFRTGLVAGLPSGTLVAHKFGEHTTMTPEGVTLSHQLHDCGIVYYPGRPYFICVMTKGSDFTKLESVISDISSIVYKKVSSEN